MGGGDSNPRIIIRSCSKRCQHCAAPLSKDMVTSDWTLPPLIRDSFSMIGSAVGGTASAFYGFNNVMPIVRKCVKGPMWLHFLIGAPPVIVFSSACAGLAGGAVPALAQLTSNLIRQQSRLHHCRLLPRRMSDRKIENNFHSLMIYIIYAYIFMDGERERGLLVCGNNAHKLDARKNMPCFWFHCVEFSLHWMQPKSCIYFSGYNHLTVYDLINSIFLTIDYTCDVSIVEI